MYTQHCNDGEYKWSLVVPFSLALKLKVGVMPPTALID